MKNICDDIYVCKKSLNSRIGGMYLNARQISQGTQRAYNVRDISQLEKSQLSNSLSQPILYSQSPFVYVNDSYEMSQDITSIYSSQEEIDIMKSISEPPNYNNNDILNKTDQDISKQSKQSKQSKHSKINSFSNTIHSI